MIITLTDGTTVDSPAVAIDNRTEITEYFESLGYARNQIRFGSATATAEDYDNDIAHTIWATEAGQFVGVSVQHRAFSDFRMFV